MFWGAVKVEQCTYIYTYIYINQIENQNIFKFYQRKIESKDESKTKLHDQRSFVNCHKYQVEMHWQLNKFLLAQN